MLCNARTCSGCRYLGQDEQDERTASLTEFLADCQHAKCKVVRLVRQQMSKLQNMQYKVTASEKTRNETAAEVHEPFDDEVDEVYGEMKGEVEQAFNESEIDKSYEVQRVAAVAKRTPTSLLKNAATASLRRTASPGRAADRKWMLRILDRVRHRAHLILAAAAVGVIVWTALVYGVFLGATACGSGRSCIRSSLKYTYAKRTLF